SRPEDIAITSVLFAFEQAVPESDCVSGLISGKIALPRWKAECYFPHIMLTVYEDVRYALRLIRGNPTSSMAVLLSLTLGIGASASMFGVVDSFIFRPLPVAQTDRVVRITSVTKGSATGQISYPDFDDLRKRVTVFEALTAAWENAAGIDS